MAFDYGSIDLGLKNPFKKEGLVTALRGGIQAGLGMYLLVAAASEVKEQQLVGWVLVLFGVFLLGAGLRSAGAGAYAMLRYFVGRNHPTSLARNFSKSEASTSQEEAAHVAYSAQLLEEMLVGRKNSTFKEPRGFLARLIHSIFPKLLFMPYPIRNLAQRLFGTWVKTLVALLAYGFVAFVSFAGFAGAAGELMFPLYSALLLGYLLWIWRSAGRPIDRKAEMQIETSSVAGLVKVIAMSLLVPVLLALAVTWLMQQTGVDPAEMHAVIDRLPQLHIAWYMLGIFALAGLASVFLVTMLRARLQAANPVAEVSELRENWQESIHPDEIFINLDNLVMANRRYKEVPNRVYRELDPQLEEQVDEKGGFRGEMMQEIQPRVKPMSLGALFEKARLGSLLVGNLLFVVAVIATFFLAYNVADALQFFRLMWGQLDAETFLSLMAPSLASSGEPYMIRDLVMSCVHLLLLGVMFKAFARILTNAAHVFFAEIQFESLLIYFKCEGTFTESKISTGTGIYDSTRSENTLVRSSITPWVIVSRIVSTTFAATGLKNLEHPRHILEMHRDENELLSIKTDVISFLKDRESIASITSHRDLANASQLHQLNEQTRASTGAAALTQDVEAASYARKEASLLEGDS
ncbi:hypothetical protein [Parahaliea mediterranea]|uniref:Uncharacterized protein n=1 Tax=Parahaliea mediterranea TaxID=651086 RepID=A0A939IKU3_9GAMM|nr:hypothetical protein [Parahaliea mediterranea]MBN7795302.1 hypothetical protein [Parahaliea mediterranea]